MEAMTTLRQPVWSLALRSAILAAVVLTIPLAGKLHWGWQWDPAGFVVWGGILFGVGMIYQLVSRHVPGGAYRIATGVVMFASFLLFWTNLVAATSGAPDSPANFLYMIVLPVGAIGAALARLKPLGMARTLVAMAATHALVMSVLLANGWGAPFQPLVMLGRNGIFIALFLLSAWLYRRASLTRPH